MNRRWMIRVVGAISLIGLLAILLGCMSFSIGGRTIVPDKNAVVTEVNQPFTQEGTLPHLTSNDERDVYYPVPFASPPNLEFTNENGVILVTEQKEDHFKVKAIRRVDWPIPWKARGVPRPIQFAKPPELGVPPQGPPQPVGTLNY